MAEEDIYGNKRKYENFVNNLDRVLKKSKYGKYHCKNKENLKYFKKLVRRFEVDDISYIRRNVLLARMKFLTYLVDCDLKDINGVEKEDVVIQMRKNYSPSDLRRVAVDIRKIGKSIFEEDEMPDFFKSLKMMVDRSRQKAKKDKLTYEEFDSIMKYFSVVNNSNIVMKAYLSLAFESLARPQELCYTKIEDVELHDNYAIVNVSEHGKEGIKQLLCIDSFPYLMQMYNQHPYRENKQAFLFLNTYNNQLTPYAINKKLKVCCEKLGIDKPITCYSIKRFGVTFRRLKGDDDVTIQKIAGWSSTKQIRTYDQSDQKDIFVAELAKRGLIKNKKLIQRYAPKTKPCEYCGELVGFAESICPKCSNLMDKSIIKERAKKDDEMMREDMNVLMALLNILNGNFLHFIFLINKFYFI